MPAMPIGGVAPVGGARAVSRPGSARLSTPSSRLATEPGASLHVSGSCAAVLIKTNMETALAEVHAELDGVPCDPPAVSSIEVADDGHIRVVATRGGATLRVAVPAVFDVNDGHCRRDE